MTMAKSGPCLQQLGTRPTAPSSPLPKHVQHLWCDGGQHTGAGRQLEGRQLSRFHAVGHIDASFTNQSDLTDALWGVGCSARKALRGLVGWCSAHIKNLIGRACQSPVNRKAWRQVYSSFGELILDVCPAWPSASCRINPSGGPMPSRMNTRLGGTAPDAWLPGCNPISHICCCLPSGQMSGLMPGLDQSGACGSSTVRVFKHS